MNHGVIYCCFAKGNPSSMTMNERVEIVGTTLNALSLLSFFSNSRAEIGLTEFTRLSGMNKATTLRHLRELSEFGLIEQNPQSRAYTIGPAVLRLAALRERAQPSLEAARNIMQTAMLETGESLHMSLLQKGILETALIVETTQHSVRVSLDPSEEMPLNATASGISMLAFGPKELLSALMNAPLPKFTRSTLTEASDVTNAVTRTFQQGWSYNPGSFEDGVFGFAAPIFDIQHVAIGTIAIAVPESRATSEYHPGILMSLHKTAAALTTAFGGQPPEDFPTEFLPLA